VPQGALEAQDPLDAHRDQEVLNGLQGLAVNGLVVLVDQEVPELSNFHRNLLNDLLVLVVLDHPSALLVPPVLPVLGFLAVLCVLEVQCDLAGQDFHLDHPDHQLHHGLVVLVSHRRPSAQQDHGHLELHDHLVAQKVLEVRLDQVALVCHHLP